MKRIQESTILLKVRNFAEYSMKRMAIIKQVGSTPKPVKLIKRKPMELFRDKLVKEQDMLLRYAYSLTSDLPEAEDLVQDTMLRALNNRGKYVENVNFNGWLITIMRNLFINNYQRKSRQREVIDKNVDIATLPHLTSGSYFQPDEAFNLGEINGAIDRLGEINRVPFRMFLSGYKYNEIAEKLDVPVGTIKSRIFWARKELQKSLSEMR